jgi:hypothetical protein
VHDQQKQAACCLHRPAANLALRTTFRNHNHKVPQVQGAPTRHNTTDHSCVRDNKNRGQLPPALQAAHMKALQEALVFGLMVRHQMSRCAQICLITTTT